jgi:hypothetical protein
VRSSAASANPRITPEDARREAQQLEMGRARTSGLGDRALFGTIRSIALAFFDAYLKNDTGGRDYLRRADDRTHIAVKTK